MNQHNCRRFNGKVALVTGAAQGIGLATAWRLAGEGAKVVLADKSAAPTHEVADAMRAQGHTVAVAIADLAIYAGAQASVAEAQSAFGGIDVLVNNVGGTILKKPFWHYTEDEIKAEVERSFWPPLWCCRAVVPYMQARGGAIVNVGSNATVGIFRIPYSASKGGVVGLTTALAVELAEFNIRINCVAPGNTAVHERPTPRLARELSDQEKDWNQQFYEYVTKEGLFDRPASVEEQAAAIAFLASDDASYITGEVLDTGKRGMRISSVKR